MRNRLISAIFGLVAAEAVRRDLQLPPHQRSWHGRIAGIPYDFRPPSIQRLRQSMWNPESDKLFTPTVFGVGWAINLYRVVHPTRG